MIWYYRNNNKINHLNHSELFINERSVQFCFKIFTRVYTVNFHVINKILNSYYPGAKTAGGAERLSYYTKCYRARSAQTTRRCSFNVRSALIFGANKINHPHYPWKPSTLSPSPLVSHLPLFTFTHLGLSIAPGVVSYMCNARRHRRAQGNSCDYGGMIPSELTRLLTKLFDRTNSGAPRGEAYTPVGRNVISAGPWRGATIKLQFGNEIANVINTS